MLTSQVHRKLTECLMCHKIDVHIDLLHVIAYGPTVAKVYTSSYLELKPQWWVGG